MSEMLIRQKVLYPYRLLDRYFVVAAPAYAGVGSGILTFSERHCAHCLTRTYEGKTLYYHHVLEAKLVTPNGFCFSLMSEFIENPGENPTKQAPAYAGVAVCEAYNWKLSTGHFSGDSR